MTAYGSAEHYRKLAGKIRDKAKSVADVHARAAFDDIATEYDAMAVRLEEAAEAATRSAHGSG